MYEFIKEQSNSIADWVISHRRDFHKYAESGWMEVRTSSIIAEELTKLGYEVLIGSDVCKDEDRMGLPEAGILNHHYNWAIEHGAIPQYAQKMKDGFTGVIGILDCGDGPTVALRFDIDALPVHEEESSNHFPTANNFRSTNTDVMHACGHDGHGAIGLGVAKVLSQIKSSLKGKVKLIFQPSEEGVRGAKSIVTKGHLDDVDYVLGAHIMGDDDNSQIGVCSGTGGMATTKMDVFIKGKASHAGASPQEGNNAMLAIATAVLNIHSIPRFGTTATQVNVGKITAGKSRNVICDYGKIELECRGQTIEANEYMENYVKRAIQGACDIHSCSYNIKLMGSAIPMENSDGLNSIIADVTSNDLGLIVKCEDSLIGGSEDFSYMSNKVMSQGGQASYFLIKSKVKAANHNDSFDFTEDCLAIGVIAFAGVTYNLLKNNLLKTII